MDILDQPEVSSSTATTGNRIVAYLIDAIVGTILYYIPVIGIGVAIAYFLTRDALPFLQGQSIGKKVMKIRAVTADGAPLTNNWGATIIRNVVLLIPLFPLVELFVMMNNPDKLRLGDQWAKTKVVAA
jgi:uncharacterized RDD family membrane protein YckC